MSSDWWVQYIPVLEVQIKKLESDLSRATYGPAERRIMDRLTVLQQELNNARRAAEVDAQLQSSLAAPTELVETGKLVERGRFCQEVINQIKRIKNLHSGSGRSVAEIQHENPGWEVWKVRESLNLEDQETFNHPNQWGPTVGYATKLLSKNHGVTTHTITSWTKAYRKHQKTKQV
jgi:hypothetical protein